MSFDTGEMRDGHKILRNICDEDGIEIIHPKACEVHVPAEPGCTYIDYPRCPWNVVHEGFEGPLHAYADGIESPVLTDLDACLPRGVEVPVVWRHRGHYDYFGEYDDEEFSWWFETTEEESR